MEKIKTLSSIMCITILVIFHSLTGVTAQPASKSNNPEVNSATSTGHNAKLIAAQSELDAFKRDSPDEKMNFLRYELLRLKVKLETARHDSPGSVTEIQTRITDIESKIKLRTPYEQELITSERRQIERLTGYEYKSGQTISDQLNSFSRTPGQLNELRYKLLQLQAKTESGFRTMNEDEKTSMQLEIQNIRNQITKLEKIRPGN